MGRDGQSPRLFHSFLETRQCQPRASIMSFQMSVNLTQAAMPANDDSEAGQRTTFWKGVRLDCAASFHVKQWGEQEPRNQQDTPVQGVALPLGVDGECGPLSTNLTATAQNGITALFPVLGASKNPTGPIPFVHDYL
jgi:hypothetical protein